jgi:hypothetical protein
MSLSFGMIAFQPLLALEERLFASAFSNMRSKAQCQAVLKDQDPITKRDHLASARSFDGTRNVFRILSAGRPHRLHVHAQMDRVLRRRPELQHRSWPLPSTWQRNSNRC